MSGSHPDSRKSGAPSLASSLDASDSPRIDSALSSEQERNRAEVELEGEKEVLARVQAECLESRKLQEQQSGDRRQEQKHNASVENARQEQEAERQEKEPMRAQNEQELQGKALRQQEEQEVRERLHKAAVMEQQKLEAKLESGLGEKEQMSPLL